MSMLFCFVGFFIFYFFFEESWCLGVVSDRLRLTINLDDAYQQITFSRNSTICIHSVLNMSCNQCYLKYNLSVLFLETENCKGCALQQIQFLVWLLLESGISVRAKWGQKFQQPPCLFGFFTYFSWTKCFLYFSKQCPMTEVFSLAAKDTRVKMFKSMLSSQMKMIKFLMNTLPISAEDYIPIFFLVLIFWHMFTSPALLWSQHAFFSTLSLDVGLF